MLNSESLLLLRAQPKSWSNGRMYWTGWSQINAMRKACAAAQSPKRKFVCVVARIGVNLVVFMGVFAYCTECFYFSVCGSKKYVLP